ncbi:enoyl-CoA hydratase/isomerase family protein [Aggregicoccus sp. 17bor-14]|nr:MULTISPECIES: enoyl-CoA hydratase-related protein [Myxococcaceae]MBF5044422.1 enoyl-CoA hydratase/isomerase family protein [Simulacricoccus sp. 17bor-14]MRI90169.1 enoyl-CoA hydratase/isomerase family protein [Aggregicoccus sp. 17bor-14]
MGIEDRPDGVRVLTLARPSRRNALDDALVAALHAALAPEACAGVRALLLRGHGGTFCSGYDLTGLGPPAPGGSLPDDALMALLARLESHPVPSVALVEGAAFGAGFDLAAACDFRVGTQSALFSMPPARLGVVYSADGIARVSRLVGPARAKLLFLTGRKLEGAAALAWGLLDECHPEAAGAEGAALALCEAIAAGAPLAISGMKETFRRLARAPLTPEEAGHLRQLRAEAFASEDAREGRAAFLEKRRPRFTGR